MNEKTREGVKILSATVAAIVLLPIAMEVSGHVLKLATEHGAGYTGGATLVGVALVYFGVSLAAGNIVAMAVTESPSG